MITKPDYCSGAELYDAACESGAEVCYHSNEFLEQILKAHQVKAVLDMTCGTGLQLFYLAQHGFSLVGSDLSPGMLAVARRKAQKLNLPIPFVQGDMCTLKVGEFDAVITMFNAICHLTRAEFEQALNNIARNLNPGGIYIFDIFNANMHPRLEKALSLDATTTVGDTTERKMQSCSIDRATGLMTCTTELHTQVNAAPPTITTTISYSQIYTKQWLEEMLARNGFKAVECYGPFGSPFSDAESASILMVGKKTA